MTSPFLGILSLDTAFPRITGDAGQPDSYPFEARVKVVEGADSPRIVRDGLPDPVILRRFIAAAQELETEGAGAIVSTCGFLISAQAQIAGAVKVPVMLSALSLFPVVRAACPGRIGILTASKQSLGPNAQAATGIGAEEAAIAGLDHHIAFSSAFLATRDRQARSLDRTAIEAAVVQSALELKKEVPGLSAILLECGNLPPYADAVRAATGLPVFHLVDAAALLMRACGHASWSGDTRNRT